MLCWKNNREQKDPCGKCFQSIDENKPGNCGWIKSFSNKNQNQTVTIDNAGIFWDKRNVRQYIWTTPYCMQQAGGQVFGSVVNQSRNVFLFYVAGKTHQRVYYRFLLHVLQALCPFTNTCQTRCCVSRCQAPASQNLSPERKTDCGQFCKKILVWSLQCLDLQVSSLFSLVCVGVFAFLPQQNPATAKNASWPDEPKRTLEFAFKITWKF